MRISDWSSDVCSSDLSQRIGYLPEERGLYKKMKVLDHLIFLGETKGIGRADARKRAQSWLERLGVSDWAQKKVEDLRSEEHTSELQSLIRISYAVFCLKKKNKHVQDQNREQYI